MIKTNHFIACAVRFVDWDYTGLWDNDMKTNVVGDHLLSVVGVHWILWLNMKPKHIWVRDDCPYL